MGSGDRSSEKAGDVTLTNRAGMFKQYLLSPVGLLNLFTIFFNVFAILVCSLHWSSAGDVYIHLIYQQRGWQTVVLLCLVAAATLDIGLLLFRLAAPSERLQRVQRGKILSMLAIVIALSSFASFIEVWYVVDAAGEGKVDGGYARIVTTMILCIILTMLLVVFFTLLLCHYDQFTRPDAVAPMESAAAAVPAQQPYAVPQQPQRHQHKQPDEHIEELSPRPSDPRASVETSTPAPHSEVHHSRLTRRNTMTLERPTLPSQTRDSQSDSNSLEQVD